MYGHWNENRGNKTYQSRLTRWVDRLLPFKFNLEHIPVKNMGFANYLSPHPKNKPPPPLEDDTKYIINFINDFIFGLTKNSIENTSANRTLADKYQPIKKAANIYPQANNRTNAFCFNSCEFKLPSVTSISILSIPNSKFNQKSTHNSNIINSITPNLTHSIYPKSIYPHNSIYKSTNHRNSKFTNSINSFSTNSIYTEPIYQNNTYISKSKIPINPQGQVNVTTCNRPRYNTFEKQITLRKRAPNKSKSKNGSKQK